MQKSARARSFRAQCMAGIAAAATLASGLAAPAFAAVTPDGVTPASVVDTTNTQPWWVGVAIRGEAGNSGATCTGLLINPRTIIFAAHCVDNLPPGSYDTPTSPGNRAQVGYTIDPTFGRTNLREWLFSLDFAVPAGDARVITASSVMVWYDPRSRFGSAAIPLQGTFLPADIAIAGFDTPNELLGRDAANGMALLFSPVTGLVPIRVGGYGQSGNGFDGTRTASTVEESYFRRLVNNSLGFLGDERSLALGIYPTATADLLEPPGFVYQDLYWADFDDPQRATRPFFNGPGVDPICPATNLNCRLDHDPFPGAAVAGEGITAAGDSGSPLATTAFGRQVSLGVLSQGTRFFYESIGNPNDNFVRFTGFSNFGTVAGYNPLFLFWDQIVVNNPYKYVAPVAGDGEWTDPARWVQELDPIYMILSGSTLANGLPSTPALGVSNATPNVGAINPSPSPAATCAFLGTCPPTGGTSEPSLLTVSMDDDGTAPAPANAGHEGVIAGAATSQATAENEGVIPGTPAEEAQTTALWSTGTLIPVNTGTLTGPGTTNFVPSNTNGTPGLQNSARFFEANFRAAGTTFLTGTTITIDRLSVRGANAGLNIRAGARLNTTISSYVDAGTLTVNGIFDPTTLFVLGGKVMGTGTIDALVANSGGRVAPGNSIGTMNIVGNYVQGAGGLLEIELSNAASDLLAVTGNASLGGTVSFQPFGTPPVNGNSYVFVSTGGTVTGAFSTVLDLIPGDLFPVVTYGANFARVTVRSLCSFSAGGILETPVCNALASADVQSDPDMIPAISQLQALAVASPAAFDRALQSLNPTRAHAQAMVGLSAGDLLRNQFGRRTNDLLGGVGTAGMAQVDLPGAQLASSDPTAEMLASAATAALAGADSSSTIELPNGHALFFAADVAITDTDQPAGIGQDVADVAALTAGLDHNDGQGFVFGGALSYLQSNVAQDYGLGGSTSSEGFAASAYGTLHCDRLYIDAFLSHAWHSFETERTLLVGPGPTAFVVAEGSTDASQTQAGATLGYALSRTSIAAFNAVGGLYYISLDIDGYTETGAGPLSAVIPSRSIESLKAQLGGEVTVRLQEEGGLMPIVRLVWNHEFMDDALLIRTGFAGAPATTFATPGPDLGTDWTTLGVGLAARVSEGTSFYIRYQHDFGRDDQENQEVSAAARMAF